ncbi:uncharacterized protein AMSG_05103 [Thecamonas trahens ATCC 50062]|uniref:Uncharacterized protein n=1 Tax=Thecamonas trahens ATCC 50062 TaxID=461836 RepID=A0A0L0DAM7_THETB|nr:hypothetical protein AMSG_05103 [Thecamonas trahens ATCC 50062]KNC49131.1 hypothetical protein AMSG_05103 [Thecamonas trahens ATCC 50062]|eukprot:XP_013758158.1 hypothetical protein AMSG_05103 [Thecamonas trahens ATCC 50062]
MNSWAAPASPPSHPLHGPHDVSCCSDSSSWNLPPDAMQNRSDAICVAPNAQHEPHEPWFLMLPIWVQLAQLVTELNEAGTSTSASSPPAPVVPAQLTFSANVTTTFPSGESFWLEMAGMWSEELQAARWDTVKSGSIPGYPVSVAVGESEVQYWPEQSKCLVGCLAGVNCTGALCVPETLAYGTWMIPLEPWLLLGDAAYSGTCALVNDKPTGDKFVVKGAYDSTFTYCFVGSTMHAIKIAGNAGGSIVIKFSNVQAKPTPASAFAIPSYCTCPSTAA